MTTTPILHPKFFNPNRTGPFIFDRDVWGKLTTCFCYLMTSGQMYNYINNIPVIPSFNYYFEQFGLETFIYFSCLVGAGMAMIGLMKALDAENSGDDSLKDHDKRLSQCVIGILFVCFLFSLQLCMFKAKDYFMDIEEDRYARYAVFFCLLMASGFMYNFIRVPFMAPKRFYNNTAARYKPDEQDKQCILESIVVAFWYAAMITAMIFLIEGAGGIIAKEDMGEDDQCWIMSAMGTHFFFMIFTVVQYTFSYKINDMPPYIYSFFAYRKREYWLGFVNNATRKCA